MQIEFLINEFSKKINERIIIDDLIDANLIDREYINKSFLFNRKFMQKAFHIFMIGKIWIVKHIIISINC
jgi:hypothetical protein